MFLLFFCVSEVQSNNDWGVTYSPSQGDICAFKGSTVEMKCEYRHPPKSGRTSTNVIETFWITGNYPVSLETQEEYEGRVTNSCDETRGKKSCTLRITDVKESDSAVYKFRFITNLSGGGYTAEPGIRLSVTADPSADIFEGSSVTLRCSSKANPPANYTWYKKTKTSILQLHSRVSEFLLNNIQSSASGEYYCVAENQLGKRRSTNLNVDVKYPPRLPSVSVNPPGEIVVEGSVNLTCSSDANPAATYAWYKENTASPAADGPMLTIANIRYEDGGNYYCEARNSRGQHNSTLQLIVVSTATYAWYKENTASPAADGPMLTIVDIRYEDGGNYYCEARNSRGQHNSTLQLIVEYAPVSPSLSADPSADIFEGSSVTLRCSSEANPPANYTWYKKTKTSTLQPLSRGSEFLLNNIQSSDSGEYYCEAENQLGKRSTNLNVDQNSSQQLETPSTAALGNSTDQDDLCYAAVSFSKKQEEPVYSNFIPAEPKTPQHKDEEDDVEYSEVMVKKTPGPGNHDASEKICALYSPVNKVDRL
ncbi:PREDICTED: B-cell receptor CD22-like [Cyprinodon variegatus]|uniref:B-cell receptor CD22-like n=1 Tax=Cyprinodon variegatus TaxID=28743 RepID=UPI000742BE0E|nr:PREDICTED: B-cell receptor CD22-like [Cyprinodon variegatus]